MGGGKVASRQEKGGCPTFKAVVVGGSAGGMEALTAVLSKLDSGFPLPILVAQHLHKSDGGRFAEHLDRLCPLPVYEALDKAPVRPGEVAVAPANYHLLVEREETLALSVDPRVSWARPSIDVLFESAARVWAEGLVAVVLSGANFDGARGIELVLELGGRALIQDPATASSAAMPKAAAQAAAGVGELHTPKELGERLQLLGGGLKRQDASPRRTKQQSFDSASAASSPKRRAQTRGEPPS